MSEYAKCSCIVVCGDEYASRIAYFYDPDERIVADVISRDESKHHTIVPIHHDKISVNGVCIKVKFIKVVSILHLTGNPVEEIEWWVINSIGEGKVDGFVRTNHSGGRIGSSDQAA